MFLIRCFKLEKEYEEYLNKDSSQLSPHDPKEERKPRSGTIDEMREHIAALPSTSVHNLAQVGRSQSLSSQHPQLGRSVSAGIYEDDVFLVNYQKYGRTEMPYVFDDRKTRKY